MCEILEFSCDILDFHPIYDERIRKIASPYENPDKNLRSYFFFSLSFCVFCENVELRSNINLALYFIQSTGEFINDK